MQEWQCHCFLYYSISMRNVSISRPITTLNIQRHPGKDISSRAFHTLHVHISKWVRVYISWLAPPLNIKLVSREFYPGNFKERATSTILRDSIFRDCMKFTTNPEEFFFAPLFLIFTIKSWMLMFN